MWSKSLPYSVILIAGSAVVLMLVIYTAARRRSPITYPFIGLLTSAAVYSFGYAGELTTTHIRGMLAWTRLEYLGITAIPFFWLLVSARFAGRTRWLSKPVLGAMLGISTLTLALNWTAPLHHLFYRSLGVSTAGPFPLFQAVKGPFYWIFQAYVNLALAAGTIILIAALFRSPAAYRRQAGVMVVGALFPWVCYAVYILGISPYGIDTGPFGLILTGPIFALGLFRFRLLDLIPVARDAVFLGMTEGVIVLDEADRIIDGNPAAMRLFPGLGRAAVGNPITEALSRYPAACSLLTGSAEPGTEINVEIDGLKRYYQVRLSPIRNRRGRVICRALSFSDSTEQAILRQRLSSLAATDELTGTANRRAFMEQGRREIARAKRSGHSLSLIILDLDHFKVINDRWGHAAGDTVLVEACRRFKSGLRAADTLGRHGGEEFAVLLPETPPAQAVQAAERLRSALADEPLSIGEDKSVALTASFGIAGVDRVESEMIEDLVRAADLAMYQAKADGRGCVRTAAGVIPGAH
jgi:diguanylate cyclase (GGDEF)-like protein